MRPPCWPNAAAAARQIARRRARMGGIMPARVLDKRYGSLRGRRILARGARVVAISAAHEMRRGPRIEVGPDAVLPLTLGALDLPRPAFFEDAHDLVGADSGVLRVDRHQHFGGTQILAAGLRLVVGFLELAHGVTRLGARPLTPGHSCRAAECPHCS